ncbi:methyltransferase family protein [Arcicella aurantiaca]|uniref:Methyltransferase family protein n=1 Tax=Arcicella aurantiaca TaxID=591202 RepID=A0A316EF37_9BACT|nr:class I SAM-dependent methyltransferase [Arcicella aurantiaca]PWK28308.1 methyltransferase family protein [Arcicella aurantiaca]
MLNSSEEEFRMMFEAEEKLWWYRILHEKISAEIQSKFGQNKDITILDIGCGTGGLLTFLRTNQYANIQGIDYSDYSIHFSKSRNLNVQKMSIDDLNTHFQNQQFDVIICNDVFYCLDKTQITNALQNIANLIKPNGIFLSNNNAFPIFYGTHDIAVGGKWRFTLTDFQDFLSKSPLKIHYHSYWTWLLSPLVLAIRLSQQLQLKLGLIDTQKLVSDVSVPPHWLNEFFYKIVKTEEKILKRGFFGSSLFLTATK